MKIVIALGGNALGNSVAEQKENAALPISVTELPITTLDKPLQL